jgi:hypothetical protein
MRVVSCHAAFALIFNLSLLRASITGEPRDAQDGHGESYGTRDMISANCFLPQVHPLAILRPFIPRRSRAFSGTGVIRMPTSESPPFISILPSSLTDFCSQEFPSLGPCSCLFLHPES